MAQITLSNAVQEVESYANKSLDPIITKEDFSRAICNMVVNGNVVLSKDFVENIDLVYATYQAKHMRNQLALNRYFMNKLSKLP